MELEENAQAEPDAARRARERRAMQNNFGRGGYPGPQQQPSGGPQMAPQMKAAGGFKGAVGALAVAQKMAAQPQDTSESTPARGAGGSAPYHIYARAAMPLLPATALTARMRREQARPGSG